MPFGDASFRQETKLNAHGRPFFSFARVPALTALALLSITCSKQADSWRPAGHAVSAAVAPAKRRYLRVEDLPTAPVRRVEDLPVAPASAVRPLRPEEVTPALLLAADDLLWNDDPPLGTEVKLDVESKAYIARLELHHHAIGGRIRPWGYHKGVTLYATE